MRLVVPLRTVDKEAYLFSFCFPDRLSTRSAEFSVIFDSQNQRVAITLYSSYFLRELNPYLDVERVMSLPLDEEKNT